MEYRDFAKNLQKHPQNMAKVVITTTPTSTPLPKQPQRTLLETVLLKNCKKSATSLFDHDTNNNHDGRDDLFVISLIKEEDEAECLREEVEHLRNLLLVEEETKRALWDNMRVLKEQLRLQNSEQARLNQEKDSTIKKLRERLDYLGEKYNAERDSNKGLEVQVQRLGDEIRDQFEVIRNSDKVITSIRNKLRPLTFPTSESNFEHYDLVQKSLELEYMIIYLMTRLMTIVPSDYNQQKAAVDHLTHQLTQANSVIQLNKTVNENLSKHVQALNSDKSQLQLKIDEQQSQVESDKKALDKVISDLQNDNRVWRETFGKYHAAHVKLITDSNGLLLSSRAALGRVREENKKLTVANETIGSEWEERVERLKRQVEGRILDMGVQLRERDDRIRDVGGFLHKMNSSIDSVISNMLTQLKTLFGSHEQLLLKAESAHHNCPNSDSQWEGLETKIEDILPQVFEFVLEKLSLNEYFEQTSTDLLQQASFPCVTDNFIATLDSDKEDDVEELTIGQKFSALALNLSLDFQTSQQRYDNQEKCHRELLKRFAKCLHEIKKRAAGFNNCDRNKIMGTLDDLRKVAEDSFESAQKRGILRFEMHAKRCWNLVLQYMATLK